MKMKNDKYRNFLACEPLSASFVVILAKVFRGVIGKSIANKADIGRDSAPFITKKVHIRSESSESPNSRCGFVTGEHS